MQVVSPLHLFTASLLTLITRAGGKLSLAGRVCGRLNVNNAVRVTAELLDDLTDTTLLGHTVLIHHALGKYDLDYLSAAIHRKSSEVTVYKHDTWSRRYWSHTDPDDFKHTLPNNLVLFDIDNYLYMRQVVCNVHVIIISLTFKSIELSRTRQM